MSINCYECKLTMTCMLKRSIVDWHNLNVFYRGNHYESSKYIQPEYIFNRCRKYQ